MVHLRWLSVREEKGLGCGEEERNCSLRESKGEMEEMVPVRIDGSQEGLAFELL